MTLSTKLLNKCCPDLVWSCFSEGVCVCACVCVCVCARMLCACLKYLFTITFGQRYSVESAIVYTWWCSTHVHAPTHKYVCVCLKYLLIKKQAEFCFLFGKEEDKVLCRVSPWLKLHLVTLHTQMRVCVCVCVSLCVCLCLGMS